MSSQLRSALIRSARRTCTGVTPYTSKRTLITLKDHIYFARATAEGAGRAGIVTSDGDAPLELKLALPKAFGGKGDGQNPEQLFAMGYSSCFIGAIQLAASRAGKKEVGDRAKVHAKVYLGHPTDREGFGLKVDINVEGVEDDAIIAAAHDICPYSLALREGIEVNVAKA
ncbi:hypothetical protein HETIRDRAFT_459374 [Heterobasidion irregulare TC 32-1]|uniref:Organic hydroperoxide resistance protein n=1 Tax=Heterobasidion irregulare (strain TC 32-1) TaxID=747525 RepID=W4K5M9_HETIT|nr:uncharacterized protein HETIRDRAFT_459374 [Heterobasidion irregulare TC 32-1]ETW80665.1 hypothetical protein HETIRDRAFT_459374 [Heterobasidion irregulare TC 32-1]